MLKKKIQSAAAKAAQKEGFSFVLISSLAAEIPEVPVEALKEILKQMARDGQANLSRGETLSAPHETDLEVGGETYRRVQIV